jgi:Holliday junction resolvase
MPSKINSREKGKRGERDFRDVLRGFGYSANRGQQFKGSPDSPDVVAQGLKIHFEVKYRERISIRESWDQATKDCGNNIPVLAHRSNRTPWLVTLSAEDFLNFLKLVNPAKGPQDPARGTDSTDGH